MQSEYNAKNTHVQYPDMGAFLVRKTGAAMIKDGQPEPFCSQKGRHPFAF